VFHTMLTATAIIRYIELSTEVVQRRIEVINPYPANVENMVTF